MAGPADERTRRILNIDEVSFDYFVYISDSKVDMLLQQIDPSTTRGRTFEVSIDLKVLKGSWGSGSIAGAERTARLQQVVRYLTEHGDVGSVDEPGQFFWGMLPLRWGPMVGADGWSLVYFGGRTEQTVVGLGGSRSHVFGATVGSDRDPPITRSLLPSLLEGIMKAPEIGPLLIGEDQNRQDDDHEGDAEALDAVWRMAARLRGPAQNMEFVAKRLLHGRHRGERVVLGSPLYVALVG